MNRRITWPVLAMVTALLAVGCASVDYQRLGRCPADQSEEAKQCRSRDENARGLRYLDLSPYLIVHTNPNGTLNLRLEYLPDPHKKMTVLPTATGAKIETTFEFERGALKKADTLADATAVPKALLEAAKSILPAVLEDVDKAAGTKQHPEHHFPAPQIFKLLVRGDEVLLVGGGQNEPFAITLLEVPPPPHASTGGTPAASGGQS